MDTPPEKVLTFNGRYTIDLNESLSAYSTGTIPAYACSDRFASGKKCFVLLVKNPLPRYEHFKVFLSCGHPHLVTFLEWGTIFDPFSNETFIALIFEKPLGERLGMLEGQLPHAFKEYEVIEKFLTPFLSLLRRFNAFSKSHRAICIENIYFAHQEGHATLGEGISSPPAYNQPLIYEPYYRAMAVPIGRGNGRIEDDIYALGVTLLFLFLGKDPFFKEDPEKIIAGKLQEGSFAFLTKNQVLPVKLASLLRGMLADDPLERWTLEDISQYLEGKAVALKSQFIALITKKTFEFKGTSYSSPRMLAYEMSKDFEGTLKALEGESLKKYIASIQNKEEAFSLGVFQLEKSPEASLLSLAEKKLLLAKTLILLDPLAPLRLEDVSCMPDALPDVIAQFMIDQKDLSVFYSLFRGPVFEFWGKLNKSRFANDIYKDLDAYSFLMERQTIGYGLIHCVYLWKSHAPCLSPFVFQDQIFEPASLLPALDHYLEKNKGCGEILDDHIAAFILTRSSKMKERYLNQFSQNDLLKKTQARLEIFECLYNLASFEGLPHLTSWLLNSSGILITQYRNLKLRKQLEARLKEIGRTENLREFFEFFKSLPSPEKDERDYQTALIDFKNLTQTIEEAQINFINQTTYAEQLGARFAAYLMIFFTFFFLILILLFNLGECL